MYSKFRRSPVAPSRASGAQTASAWARGAIEVRAAWARHWAQGFSHEKRFSSSIPESMGLRLEADVDWLRWARFYTAAAAIAFSALLLLS